MKPELSKAHLNVADRDLEYEKRVQLQPHIVYLSNTGSVKVGITRKSQIPIRWIDQGAHEAIELISGIGIFFLYFNLSKIRKFYVFQWNRKENVI
jgi:hypothetical protein